MSTLAEATRAAVRERPFVLAALRAGVLNHAAAARFLDVGDEADAEAVATALRRLADELPAYAVDDRSARTTMESGLGPVESAAGDGDEIVRVGGTAFAPGAGSLTAVLATGDADAAALGAVLDRLRADGIDPAAAGVAGGTLAVVVDRRDGPATLRLVEDALAAVPTGPDADSTV